jgi:hypothetical protein
MVLNATFNNSSVMSWRSVLLLEVTRVRGENHRPDKSLTNFMLTRQISFKGFSRIKLEN